jgi:hypothetical protein
MWLIRTRVLVLCTQAALDAVAANRWRSRDRDHSGNPPPGLVSLLRGFRARWKIGDFKK